MGYNHNKNGQDSKCAVAIKEAYKDYVPPLAVHKVITRLISGISQRYLIGLKTIVLTNAKGLSHDRRRAKTWARKRKVSIIESFGLYHEKWQGEPAWIEIFVDNVLQYWPSSLSLTPFFRDFVFADVFFHELGHHIHKTQMPQHKEREDVADKGRSLLMRQYLRRKYWYLMPVLLPLYFVAKPLYRFLMRRKGRSGGSTNAQ